MAVRKRVAWSLVLATASLLVLAGCGSSGDENNNLTGNPDDTAGGDIAITVGSGLNPTYSWAGVGVFEVTVVRASGVGAGAWQIVSGNALDDIPSPVTHGAVPAGAVATVTTETTLTAGVLYSVHVARTTITTTSDFGFKTFTP